MPKRALIAAAVAIAAVGALILASPALVDVVRKGDDLRPYESGRIYELRVADAVTVYADEESQPSLDYISGSALVALATASLMSGLLLGSRGPRLRRFYGLAAAGFPFLGFDEFLAVHETIGHNLTFLADLPGVERPDDVVYALMLLPAVAFCWAFRDIMLAPGWPRRIFGAALGAFLLAALSDVAGQWFDEPLEVLCAVLIAGGFAGLMSKHLGPLAAVPTAAAPPIAEPAPEAARG